MDDLAGYIGSYSINYISQSVIESMKTSHLLGIFFRLDSEPPLHVWCGINDIPSGFDAIDPEGTVYLGGGRLLNVPTLETLINGVAGVVTFGLSGIDPVSASRVIEELPDVRGKEVKIGFTTLDHYYQPVSRIIPIWTGQASHTGEQSPPVKASENPTTTVTLATMAGTGSRSRGSLSVWTSAHQKAEYPTDKGCDQVARLGRGVAPAWPVYS